jgi:hypothetical protein
MRYTTFCLLFMTSSAALAVDYGQLYESVDKDKAAESVEREQAKEAAVEGDVKKGYDSVDNGEGDGSLDEIGRRGAGATGATKRSASPAQAIETRSDRSNLVRAPAA